MTNRASQTLRFDEYMRLCLYGPNGFYAGEPAEERPFRSGAGRTSGDFITSPEVGPLFGAVLANALDQWWDEAGCPDPFTIYDVGCGPGTLLQSIHHARPDRPWRLVGVDSHGLADLTVLPDQLDGAVVLANELLDNIVFRIVESTDAGLREVFVSVDNVAPVCKATPMLRDTDKTVAIPVGTSAPVVEAAAEWLSATLASNPLRVCLIDYAAASTVELANRGGWLRTYQQHERGTDPYHQPGYWDITTDIPIDQLAVPHTIETQADFLQRWGIEGLVDEGRAWWKANAHAPDVAALRMRSRVAEAEALLDPDGLGSWCVMTYEP